jgi:hypothetical protein
MLGHELDILMGERQTLLKVVGATAAFIASLDSGSAAARCDQSADLVATAINTLPDETCARRLRPCARNRGRNDAGGAREGDVSTAMLRSCRVLRQRNGNAVDLDQLRQVLSVEPAQCSLCS